MLNNVFTHNLAQLLRVAGGVAITAMGSSTLACVAVSNPSIRRSKLPLTNQAEKALAQLIRACYTRLLQE